MFFAAGIFAGAVLKYRKLCPLLYYKALREVAHLRELEYVRFVTAIHTKVPQARFFLSGDILR